MTAQEYLFNQLKLLGSPSPSSLDNKENETLTDQIYRLLVSHKFRKYAVSPEFSVQIKQAIHLNISRNEPLKIVFLHGAYKLWRLAEAPEPDWAELFSAMYYTQWLKPICEIYPPGVWFDYFVDDLIIAKIDNIKVSEIESYLLSYQHLLDFLSSYQPSNFKMTITPVTSQFSSMADFEKAIQAHYTELLKNPPPLTLERIRMINLNRRPSADENQNPNWQQENALLHDAYVMAKRGTGYHFQPDKIIAFTNPLPSGTVLAVGSTKATVAKFWAGIGALKIKGDSFQEYVLSPQQMAQTSFELQKIRLPGLLGQNFQTIRLFK